MVSIDIGCGNAKRADIGVDIRRADDADIQADIRSLPFDDAVASEVYLIDVIEHLRFMHVEDALREVYRVLEPNGNIWIRTPDFEWIVENYDAVDLFRLQRKLYGGYTDPVDRSEDYPENQHQSIWTADTLTEMLQSVGFESVTTNRSLPPPNHWNAGVVAIKSDSRANA